jgi:hypothetical protein
MERTSFKDNLIRQQEKIHEIRQKRFIYENKKMGCLKRIYPSDDSIKQAWFEEYLNYSQNKQHPAANIQPLREAKRHEPFQRKGDSTHGSPSKKSVGKNHSRTKSTQPNKNVILKETLLKSPYISR